MTQMAKLELTLEEVRRVLLEPPLPKDLKALCAELGLTCVSIDAPTIRKQIADEIASALAPGASKVTWTLKKQAVLEHILENAPIDPVWSLLGALHGGEMRSSADNDWGRALKLGRAWLELTPGSSPPFSIVPPVRLLNVANSAYKLREMGYDVWAESGKVVIKDEGELSNKIELMIEDIGAEMIARVTFATLIFEPIFSRYRLTRSVGYGYEERNPTVPIGFILDLVARNMIVRGANALRRASDPEVMAVKIGKLMEVSTWYLATKDIEIYSIHERMLFRHDAVLELLRGNILYDNVFAFPQIAPDHVIEVLGSVFHDFSDEECRSAWGGIVSDVVHVCRQIFSAASSARGPIVFPRPLASDTPSCAQVINCLIHAEEADEDHGDLAEAPKKPLIDLRNGDLMMLDAHWCGPAFYEAMAQSLRTTGIPRVDARIGPGVERVVYQALQRRGISFAKGEYLNSRLRRRLECDCVLETKRTILIIEIKKRPLTPRARKGHDVSLLADLCAGLLKSQIQALRHEVQLRAQGRINFLNGDVVHREGRDYERISITLTEYGTLHDRESARQFLQAALACEFRTADPDAVTIMEELEGLQSDLRDAVAEMKQLGASHPEAFLFSAFLSIPQFLTLLDDVKTADGLADALRGTRATSTGTGDFIFDYAFNKALRED